MTKIYYFSATGNSLWSAKKIAQSITAVSPLEKCELLNIGVETLPSTKSPAQAAAVRQENALTQQGNTVIEADAIIFIFPSFAYGMPHVVRNFMKNANFKTSYAAALVTYGSSPGGTLGSALRILRKKDIGKMFFYSIPAVENYLAIFGTPKEETIKLRCKMQAEATEEASRLIIERKENKVSTFYPFSFFIYSLFTLGKKLFYNFYQVSKKCNGCSTCEKVCPVSAIVMKNGRPRFTSKCEHCQACINLCPLRAIQFSRVKFGSPGYRHPDIQISELKK